MLIENFCYKRKVVNYFFVISYFLNIFLLLCFPKVEKFLETLNPYTNPGKL